MLFSVSPRSQHLTAARGLALAKASPSQLVAPNAAVRTTEPALDRPPCKAETEAWTHVSEQEASLQLPGQLGQTPRCSGCSC